ncbi:MAG: ParB/RepB/Spo0J family partition protein [Deltaproteobacteria bacterium]|nr:ParB/RepB/Spo0J family partition protein [Deltaproteobacteria bacterium]
MIKRQALGKGLSALIPNADQQEIGSDGYFQCPIEDIQPNPYQPRLSFSEPELEELILSIRENGVITPILLSKTDNGYQLIAGERRWRAAQRAGLDRIPAVVRETTAVETLELALIENIHRQDLSPIEEALAYQRWLEDMGTTQEVLARKMGKDRSTITNMLRLLNLPRNIQKDLIEGRLTMGHSRVLAGLKTSQEQQLVRDKIIKGALSVRQTEGLVKRLQAKDSNSNKNKEGALDSYIQSIATNLEQSLGTRVKIKRRGKKGSINILFHSDEELDRLIECLG